MLFFSMAVNILLLAPSLHLLQVYDRVLTSQSQETLVFITCIAAIALVFYAISELVRTRIAMRLSNRFVITYAERVFDFLVYDRHNSFAANQIMRDMNTIRAFIAGRQFVALYDVPFFPLFLGFMFLLHPTLGAIAMLGILAISWLAFLNHWLTKQAREVADKARGEADNFSLAVLRRTDDVRAMGLLPSILQGWGGKTATSLNSADQAASSSAFFYSLSRCIRQVLQIGVMAWGAYLVLQGDMSGGMIFAASLLLGKALGPVEQLVGGWDGIAAFMSAWASIKDVSRKIDRPYLTELPSPEGRITVENLTFHPGKELGLPPVVENVSFTLSPGEVMAVVGPSGAGKSTIARLLVGAMAADSGIIRLDDFDITQWREDQRGRAIGYVPQDILLFPGTIAQNIARLEPQAQDEQVITAAKLAGVHDMIASLPEGYGTMIGPGAVPLSGGQRQRIALARAFYTSPKVLVLDEPNAHLDQYGEKLLMDCLAAAREEKIAVLVISQRKSILKIADRVMVIIDGKVHSISETKTKPATGQAADHSSRLKVVVANQAEARE
jgi:ATP-binding cassette subfamily C protein